MTFQQLQSELLSIEQACNGKVWTIKDRNIIEKIYSLYYSVYGFHFRKGCSSCFEDCYFTLKKITNEQMDRIMNCEFELKGGAYLCDFATPDHMTTWISKANISNQAVLWHLCKCPNNIERLQKYPADWKERISGMECKEFPIISPIEEKEEVFDFISDENAQGIFSGADEEAEEKQTPKKKRK